MAKKFVRGITDINEINKQDFDTNNVNDLLSDGEHNYIHRKKKDNSEEYHNLTNNLKTITSDNTDLLSVMNYNNSTNSATLHPQHDTQKEQTIESIRNTITINHGDNATSETTKVDTNPQIVLEHENLKTTDSLNIVKNGNTSTISFETTKKPYGTVLSELATSLVYGYGFPDSPEPTSPLHGSYITLKVDDDKKIQFFTRESTSTQGLIIMSYRFVSNDITTPWREMLIDNNKLMSLFSEKQNVLVSSGSIGVINNTLRQLYALKNTYSATGGLLITHVKSISENTKLNNVEEEFNFTVKLNKGVSSVNFTLNNHDTTKFSNIMTTYGENNTVRISGCVFTLSGSTLTVSTTNNTSQNYVITFSDII